MADQSQTINAGQLIALLTEQRDLYQRLKELAATQRAVLSSDRPERLLDVLRERQSIVTKLAQLNMHLAPYRRDWNGTYGQLPEDTRAQAAGLLDEINEMLQTILKADREDSALLSARKQAVAREMNEVSGGRAVNAAYGKQGGSTPVGGSTADMTG